MEQGSSNFKKEDNEMMNIEEVARAIEYLHALGISHEETCNFLKYVATGVGLPVKESAAEEE